MSLEKTLPWLLAAACLFLATYYAWTQGVVNLDGGAPYDARHYAAAARQLARGEVVHGTAPFVYRPGLPYLVSLGSADEVRSGFRTLNLAFSGLNLFLLFRLLSRFSASKTRIWFLLLLLALNPLGPLRFTHFFPVHVDPPGLTFILLAFLLFLWRPVPDALYCALASALCFAGVFFRETVLVPFMAVLCQQVLRSATGRGGPGAQALRRIGLAALPVLAGLAAVWIAQGLPQVTGGYSFTAHTAAVLRRNLGEPSILLLAVLAILGPFLVMPLSSPRECARLLRELPWVGFFLLGILLLGSFAGSHTDRLVFWAHPAVLILALRVWEQQGAGPASARKAVFFVLLLAVSGLMYRAFAPIPGADVDPLWNHPTSTREAGATPPEPYDPATPRLHVLAPYGDDLTFAQTYVAYMSAASRRALLAQLVPCLLLLVFLYRRLILAAPDTGAGRRAPLDRRTPTR